MNKIDRLRKLLEAEYHDQPWQYISSRHIVIDSHNDVVAENVSDDGELIIEAVNSLPGLLEIVELVKKSVIRGDISLDPIRTRELMKKVNKFYEE